jgi:hypothetical protein
VIYSTNINVNLYSITEAFYKSGKVQAAEVKDREGSWLKYSSDRKGGQKRRADKKHRYSPHLEK